MGRSGSTSFVSDWYQRALDHFQSVADRDRPGLDQREAPVERRSTSPTGVALNKPGFREAAPTPAIPLSYGGDGAESSSLRFLLTVCRRSKATDQQPPDHNHSTTAPAFAKRSDPATRQP